MKVLDDELSAAKQKNEELERQLREKPIEVTSTVEVIPENVQAELDELRKKVGQAGDETATKFKLHFEIIKKDFEGLMGFLNEAPEEKYKTAVIKLLDILKSKI